MKIKYEDIAQAFEYVSSGPYGDHTAVLDKSSGGIHCRSDMAGIDEIPEELWESDDAIEIPHKNDLGLGNRLVFDFVSSQSPDDYAHVREIFSRRGAYARYKDLLRSKGLLQKWYDFEQQAQEEALREWCKENGIELTG